MIKNNKNNQVFYLINHLIANKNNNKLNQYYL